MTSLDIIVNLATIIAEQRLEISELKTEVAHLHHELIATMSEADTPQTDIHGLTDCDFCKKKNCEDCEGGKDEPQTAQKIAEFQKMCGIKIDTDHIRQTDCYITEDRDTQILDAWQTDCGWK